MNLPRFVRRFTMRGVFWRQFLAWGVQNVPYFLQPMILGLSTFFFFVVWGPGRRAVTRNLSAIFPESSHFRNSLRAYRVFLNFAWSVSDTAQFHGRRIPVDWVFEGYDNLERLANTPSGAILLTAHMGNYDLGSYMFAQKMNRPIMTVRVPEIDPESEAYSARQRETVAEHLRVNYNTSATAAALELIAAIQGGAIVAIQGDRVVKGVSGTPVQLFGQRTELPIGPFALAMTTRTPVFPLFVARVALRKYKVIAYPPLEVRRTDRNRDRALEAALEQWKVILEQVIRPYWYQWFTFEPYMKAEEPDAS